MSSRGYDIGKKDDTAVGDPAADGTVIGVLKGMLTKLGVLAGASPVVTNVTGSGAISISYTPVAAFWLHEVTLKLDNAPTTSQDFVILLDANNGALYDIALVREDLSEDSTDELEYTPSEGPKLYEAGDAIKVTWANSNGRTYGLRISARLA